MKNIPLREPWSTEPLLEMDRVSARYAGVGVETLKEVSLTLNEGEILLVVGATGSGKSTLLRAMTGAMPHTTGGTLSGTVRVLGRDTREFPPRMLADAIGVVHQDPQSTFVADTVEEELAYGMEQLGMPRAEMRRRMEKILDLLGIAELREMPLRMLSGGEQQRVALGAVLMANPALIVMDEPTSALDPNAADNVLGIIQRLAHEMGTAVVVAEHRIERVLQYADRVAHVDSQGYVQVGEPREIMRTSEVAPPVVELGRWAGWLPLPLSVREARVAGSALRRQLHSTPRPGSETAEPQGEVLLEARGLRVSYPGIEALQKTDLSLRGGEVAVLMGRNGCGKSTLLWALQGGLARTSGEVSVKGADPAQLKPGARRRLVGLVPQTPTDLLYLPSVREELERSDRESGADTRGILDSLLPGVPDSAHPRDLSEGQRLALVLAIQLAAGPQIILCDEPTRGLDYSAKRALVSALETLRERGHAVLIATHDVEFAALCADRVLEMAGGEIIADGPAVDILSSSVGYAPQVAKVTAGVHHDSRWLTVADVQRAGVLDA
ncbi:ABC transporter ATP-binding protein [Corynebacterium suicordis]|uniref:ATP-binding cassette domain-containing protein n=1 Tax=Corynebacterium suicordis DSM 45110 TaxID=1121369 RepID=A0ABR9ZII6_9CORY|nr:ABC transporter ATP-binding protein [Corynebacterium suicordis]MBF4553177.1 ATP-binding cassette domain-containing protein [Corynebacterium suicordis DSM 45110]MDR6277860.1 energy-coupling factor transport system ATP-binding protein [Corynebacterium suicordis]